MTPNAKLFAFGSLTTTVRSRLEKTKSKFCALPGDDRLFGGAAADRLSGQAGADFLNGGAGRPDLCKAGRAGTSGEAPAASAAG